MQGGRGAGGGGREGWESGEAGVVEEGGELRIWLDGAFVLEVAYLEVETFNLAVELRGR